MLIMRSYVIGDIHGCLDELGYLIEGLPLEACDRLIFLGDYIDRGPDSNGVISFLLELENAGYELIFLKGNHEDMFLASYGYSTPIPLPDEALSLIPPAHVKFYEKLASYYLMEPFLCVHAGIHPLKSLKDQTESELFWIRNQFIYSSHMLPYTILFGHTPQNDVLYDLPFKVGLDTGLVYGNKLTCLEATEKVLYQVQRGKKAVTCLSIETKWNS